MQRRGNASEAGTQVTLWPAFRAEAARRRATAPGPTPEGNSDARRPYHNPYTATDGTG